MKMAILTMMTQYGQAMDVYKMTPINIHKRTEEQLIKALNYAVSNGTNIVLTSVDAAILCGLIGEDKMAIGGKDDSDDELCSEER